MDQGEPNIISVQHQVETAEQALENAKRDLQEARQSLSRLMSERAASSPAASSLIADGVKKGQVTAYYDAETATVVYINDKPSPRANLHGTVSTADNTSLTDSPVACSFDPDDDDEGYLEFLAFIGAGSLPNNPSSSSDDEDDDNSYENIDLERLQNRSSELYKIPEEGSVDDDNDVKSVSTIGQASTSARTLSSSLGMCNKVIVHGCTPDAIHIVAGVYHKFDTRDGVPCYSKIAKYEGKETMFNIGRWKVNNGVRKWYITGVRQDEFSASGKKLKKLAFYYAYSNEDLPPTEGWMECTEGKETFLWPAYVARGCSLGRSFEYPPPISLEREWRNNSSIWSRSSRGNDMMTL